MSACANTVAVVVPSPATSLVFVATSLTNEAPDILEFIGQIYFFCDGHAVVSDEWRAITFIQN